MSGIRALVACTLAALLLPAQAQVNKCRQPDGRIVYAQAPCEAAGAQPLGELKIVAPPAPAPTPLPAQRPGDAPAAPAPAATAAPPRARPAAPPGVDDPLADPTRPRRCAEQQNTIDGSVATLKQLELRQQTEAQHFENMERRIDEFNASPDGRKRGALNVDNRYALRQREKDATIAEIGSERVRLRAHVQEAYRLHCDVLGIKLRLADAERLQSQPVGTPRR